MLDARLLLSRLIVAVDELWSGVKDGQRAAPTTRGALLASNWYAMPPARTALLVHARAVDLHALHGLRELLYVRELLIPDPLVSCAFCFLLARRFPCAVRLTGRLEDLPLSFRRVGMMIFAELLFQNEAARRDNRAFRRMSLPSRETHAARDANARHSRRWWHATCFQDLLVHLRGPVQLPGLRNGVMLVVMLVAMVQFVNVGLYCWCVLWCVLARMQRKPWFSRANFELIALGGFLLF